MISSLAGTVAHVSSDRVVITVGGVGFEAFATPTTLSALKKGSEVTLFTELVVREDSLTLYGFSEADERDAFRTLMTVKGIGPRLALTTLAALPADSLRKAVASGDVAALQRIPGVGKKSAQRMLIEIGDKLGAPLAALSPTEGSSRPLLSDVVAALVQLGWSEAVAEQVVRDIIAREDAPTEVGALLRAALQQLDGKRK